MADFISGGSRFPCPVCNRLQLFERHVPEEALPITVRCSFQDCNYRITYSKGDHKPTFPKLDPINRIHGNWVVEIQTASDKDYWKPVSGTLSFRERCNAIATHLAGALQVTETLREDLRHLAEAMTEQFTCEWGLHHSFLKMWNPGKVESWVKQPFASFPVDCQDTYIKDRTRLLIHPNFFTPVVGWPLKNYGGFNLQFISTYFLVEFPMESWFWKLLDIRSIPKLKVVDDRIVGRDLFLCWKDIPGTVPDIEHQDEAPLLRITDSFKARTWLVRLGISPWNIGELTEEHGFKALGTYYLNDTPKRHQKDAYYAFRKYGRIALFDENRNDAWETALTIGSFLYGQKLVLTTTADQKEQVASLMHEVKANTGFHWKVIKEAADLIDIPWEQISYLIVDYQADFPPEALELLYAYNGRLIIIGHDPIMDTVEENWEAIRFYGLVGKTLWHPTSGLPTTPFDYSKGQSSIVSSMLANWHDDRKIIKGRKV